MNKTKLLVAATLFGPPIGIVITAILLWGKFVAWLDLLLLVCFYVLTVIGLTAGFHRLFAHKSFDCKTWLRGCLAVFGCMAAQGPIFFWVATHRTRPGIKLGICDEHGGEQARPARTV